MHNIYDAITAEASNSDAAAERLDAYVAICQARANGRE